MSSGVLESFFFFFNHVEGSCLTIKPTPRKQDYGKKERKDGEKEEDDEEEERETF